MNIGIVAHIVFQAWMMADAFRRGAHWGWKLAILFPLGAWLYLFTKYMGRDGPSRKARVKIERDERARVDLAELERVARETPSVANKAALGHALLDRGENARAVELYEQVRARDPRDRASQWGLGRARRRLGDLEGAVEPLAALCASDPAWQDSGPCFDLVQVYEELDRRGDAVELMRALVHSTRRLTAQVELARLLGDAGEAGEARAVLEQALEDYEGSPDFVKKGEKAAAKRARTLLSELD